MNRQGLKTVGFVGMIVAGAASILLPLLAAALVAVLAVSRGSSAGAAAALMGSLAVVGALLGAWLVAQGVGGLRKRPSSPFKLPRPWLWVALFALTIAVMAVAPNSATIAGVTKVLAALLPGLAVLSFASRRLGSAPSPPTWRQITAQAGATLTLSLWWSIFWEVAALVGMVAAAGAFVGAMPGGAEWLQQWSQQCSDPSALANRDLLQQPAVAVFLLALMAGFVPVIEEVGKLLAVGTLALAHRPSRAQAVMWGIASGATFSVFEAALANPFSGTGAMIAILRAGAMAVHCAAAALTAWGLYEWISQRRISRFFAGLGLAMGLHAAWNALAVGAGMLTAMGGTETAPVLALSTGAFAVLILGAALVLVRIVEL